MRKILDRLFANKKLAFWLPLILATGAYLLFVLFGESPDKNELLILTPIITVFAYFGLFLVVFIQVKNPLCPEKFLDFVEIFFVIGLGLVAVLLFIFFLASGFQNFNFAICVCCVSYSAISWAHGKRTK